MTAPVLLIADDDAGMRALVRDALRADYPDSLEVADGRAMFWQLLRASFGIRPRARDLAIVADIRMPAYNGLDVLDAWQDRSEQVPIVVITSFPDDAVRDRVARLDAKLLAKPFNRRQLRDAMREAVRRVRDREEAAR